MLDKDPIILISSAVIILIIMLIGFVIIIKNYQNRKNQLHQEQLKLKLNLQAKEIEKLQALESERNRIYQDLHDNIGSTMAAAKLQSNYLKSTSPNQNRREELQDLENMIIESYDELKETVWYANSKNDTIGNLSMFIQEYALTFLEKTHIVFQYHENIQNPEKYISAIMRKDIYYSIKEMLHNIIKHSNAHRAWIRLDTDDSYIRIHVQDNGATSTSAPKSANANGMLSIAQRVDSHGGQMHVDDAAGYTIDIALPLES